MRNDKPALVGALNVDLVASEDQQVQVDLARTPALASHPADRLLKGFERGE
jgi:hypothetical protein